MQPEQDIYLYTSYQKFLRDFVDEKRKSSPQWSYGVWAKQLRLRSSSTLIMVVNGQRNPGPELMGKLAKYFCFDKNGEAYFTSLVKLHKVKNDLPLSLEIIKEVEARNPKKGFRLIDFDSFHAISNWYYYAIRELVLTAKFQEDPIWIAEQLHNKVTPSAVKQAIDTLLSLGLLKRNYKGRLTVSTPHYDTPRDIIDYAGRKFHRESLALAQEALDTVPIDLREISSGTFAIRTTNLPKAKALIRKFQMQLCNLMEEANGDSVYQVQVAFIPLTKIQRKDSH
jgi:uncharacterized protein (TIGR02147 family)